LASHAHKKLQLVVHPIIAAYLTKGIFTNKLSKLRKKHGVKLSLEENTNYHLTEFRFFDAQEDRNQVLNRAPIKIILDINIFNNTNYFSHHPLYKNI